LFVTDKQFLMGLGFLLVAAMFIDPRCNRGCRTLAGHLAFHLIDDLLLGGLA
jgi:hypothetical protein